MVECVTVDELDRVAKDMKKYGVACVNGLLDADRVDNALEGVGDMQVDPRVPSRQGGCVFSDKLDRIVEEGMGVHRKVSGDVCDTHRLAFPIEYRRYPSNSGGMDAHVDTVLYDTPQMEAVYTVSNTDTCTRFVYTDNDGKRRELQPKRGDLIYVQAGRTVHEVTPLCDGERNILKFATTCPGNVATDELSDAIVNCPKLS